MPRGMRSRVLIVDDSAVMRSLLRSVICSDPRLEVGGTAVDGVSALRSLDTVRPDLILLDVEMPVMDGLQTLRALRAQGCRLPVIMCSSLTQRGAKVTIEALAGGASDYVAKPSGQESREAAQRALAQELIPKIHWLTADAQPQLALFAARSPIVLPLRVPVEGAAPAVVAIGVSTGGPAALDALLPALPENFPLPVLIVQHMPELFTGLLAARLDGRCKLRVREAAEGEPVEAGTVVIARGNWHMEVRPPVPGALQSTLHLTQSAPENHCRPSADVLFRSVARVYGASVLAVVLTGMGADGLAGCQLIRAQGGSVLAQDRATSTVWGMPGAVANAGLAHKILPLNAMAAEIVRVAGRNAGGARELRGMAV